MRGLSYHLWYYPIAMILLLVPMLLFLQVSTVRAQEYDSEYSGEYYGEYGGEYGSEYFGEYSGEYDGEYGGEYTGEGGYEGEYTGEGGYEGEYTSEGPYEGEYSDEYPIEYPGEYPIEYPGEYPGQYNGQYTGEYHSEYNYGDPIYRTYTSPSTEALYDPRCSGCWQEFVGPGEGSACGVGSGSWCQTYNSEYSGEYTGESGGSGGGYGGEYNTQYLSQYFGEGGGQYGVEYGSEYSGPYSGQYPGQYPGEYTPPPPPSSFGLSITFSGCTGTQPYIDLQWTTSINAQHYTIYRHRAGAATDELLPITLYPPQVTYRDGNVISNTEYSYYVVASNTTSNTPSNIAGPLRTLLCDTTPPSVTFNSALNSCHVPNQSQASGVVASRIWGFSNVSVDSSASKLVQIDATDPSGVASATIEIVNLNSGTIQYTDTQVIPTSGNTYSFNVPSSALNSVTLPNNSFAIRFYATDVAGNSNQPPYPSRQFITDSTCKCAQIKTQSGDVHSNQNINVSCTDL